MCGGQCYTGAGLKQTLNGTCAKDQSAPDINNDCKCVIACDSNTNSNRCSAGHCIDEEGYFDSKGYQKCYDTIGLTGQRICGCATQCTNITPGGLNNPPNANQCTDGGCIGKLECGDGPTKKGLGGLPIPGPCKCNKACGDAKVSNQCKGGTCDAGFQCTSGVFDGVAECACVQKCGAMTAPLCQGGLCDHPAQECFTSGNTCGCKTSCSSMTVNSPSQCSIGTCENGKSCEGDPNNATKCRCPSS